MSVFLVVFEDAESQPSGWSQHVQFSPTVVNQTDDECNFEMGPTSHTFKASAPIVVNSKLLESAFLSDIRSTTPSMGYIANDTLIIKCDMTNVASNADLTAAALAPGAS